MSKAKHCHYVLAKCVAIIDSLPFGGTCALRGCDPKKVLVEAARIIDSNQRHEGKGIIGSQRIGIKWSDLIRFKRTFTDNFPNYREDSYIKAGVVPFHGHAKFIGPTTVKVEAEDNADNDNNTNLKAYFNSYRFKTYEPKCSWFR